MKTTYDTKKILIKLDKLPKYNYPIGGDYSLFILPSGKMVGINKFGNHQKILEEIINMKIESAQEVFNIFAAIETIKVIISGTSLYVDITMTPTREQKFTLEALGLCGRYDDITVESVHTYLPDAPSLNYCRRLLKLSFY